MLKQYGGLVAVIKVYWEDYGGWRDLLTSPLTHASILFSVFAALSLIDIDWRALVLSTMPTILGFSLSAYAITFGLMGGRLYTALKSAQDASGRRLGQIVNATLFHNVFTQAASLSYAVLTKGELIPRVIDLLPISAKAHKIAKFVVYLSGELIGSFLLIYAVILLFSSAIAMFRLGRLSQSEKAQSGANDDRPSRTSLLAPSPSSKRLKFLRLVAQLLRLPH